MNYSYSRVEQETTIVWDEEDKLAVIYTASPITMTKLEKMCKACPETYKRTWIEQNDNGRITAAKYCIPSKYIRFGKPASEKKREACRRNSVLAQIRGKTKDSNF